jgi:hypothetical protein
MPVPILREVSGLGGRVNVFAQGWGDETLDQGQICYVGAQ